MKKVTHSLGTKIGACILWTAAMLGCVGGTLAIAVLDDFGFYGARGAVYWPFGYSAPETVTYTFSDLYARGYVSVEGYVSDEALSLGFEPVYSGLYYFCRNFADGFFVVAGICGIAAILLLILLMCSAGHRNGQETVTANGLDKIPFDLFGVGVFLVVSVMIAATHESFWSVGALGGIVVAGIWIVAYSLVLLMCLMTLATRCKLGTVFTNTVIWNVLRVVGRFLRKSWEGFVMLCRGLPLIWKTVLVVVLLTVAEFFIIVMTWDPEVLVFFWGLEKVILIPAVLFLMLSLRTLQKGGQELAKGHLDYRVDTRYMFWDFKKHGENLNSISEGMNSAVEEKMKSERFKTELITNVSHDIKTPLTSIINYVDLISKEEPESETMAEYVGVLERQSKRLKKLIEDLVEASKASTGNINVEMSPTAVGVLLTQAAGEYDERMNEKNLELILNQPQEEVMVMADGRLLWRVFDNLLSNICKYAQSGTRVYLNLDRMDGKAVVTFRNISAYPLNLSSEELMERFTRGDSSRHTEGSGLGLSIAKSLTDLQKGEMSLYTDGDLFKVVLTFEQFA